MKMAVEIERKFLVDTIPQNKISRSKMVKQGYMVNDERQVVRVRSIDHDHFLTIKSTTKGLSRLEFEYAIPEEDARDMFEHLCASSFIEKTRHYIEHQGHLWEVDEFQGKNQGLILAEIELKSENETFQRPDWIGDEVSHDPRYYNMNLTTNPYENWKK